MPPASYRMGCVGTGPFKLKDWRRGEFVDMVKNPDYFVKGRPYLDGNSSETCTLTVPAGATQAFVSVYGYTASGTTFAGTRAWVE